MRKAALGLLLGAALLAGCTAGRPQVVAPETSYDFGKVPVITDRSQVLTKEFVIRNEGNAPLKLGEVQVKTLEGC